VRFQRGSGPPPAATAKTYLAEKKNSVLFLFEAQTFIQGADTAIGVVFARHRF